MAIKIKKKKPEQQVEEEILEQPDQVLAATQETFGWLHENRNLVLGGIGALFVAIVAGSFAWGARVGGQVEASAPILSAIADATAPVGEGATFADETARATAVRDVVGPLTGNPVASVVAGGAQLELGDADAATLSFSTASSGLGAPEQAVIAFGLAAAQAEGGNLDAAIATLEDVKAHSEEIAPLVALQVARLTDAYGTPDQALSAYRSFVAENPGASGSGDASNRIVQLEIALGVEPVAEDAASDEG